MPDRTAEERAAVILDRLPIAFEEKSGEMFLAWVSQAIRDAEAAQRERDAKLAEQYGDDSYHIAAERACYDLRDAIRKG